MQTITLDSYSAPMYVIQDRTLAGNNPWTFCKFFQKKFQHHVETAQRDHQEDWKQYKTKRAALKDLPRVRQISGNSAYNVYSL